MRHDIQAAICGNEGCERQATPGERFCEACSLEWTLFRRDTRLQVPQAGESKTAGGAPGEVPVAYAGSASVRLR